jgi:formylglycine-generating enzyme required for sulfatase activity
LVGINCRCYYILILSSSLKCAPDEMNEPIKVFISYSHQDDELRKELSSHLSGLCEAKLIEPWHDRNIDAGSGWAEEIDENLERAEIILLLVSSDFMASRYCYSIEMNQALERHRAGSAVVIPVIVRDAVWSSSPLGSIQAVPRDNKAVAPRGDKYARDTAWKEVTVEIGKVAQQIKDRRLAELTAIQKTKASQEFRAKAARYYQDGAISPTERELLDIDRQTLGLGEPEAAVILQLVAAAYQQRQSNLERYHQLLVAELSGQESLRADQRVILQELQAAFRISDAEVEQVEQRALAERDLERQQARAVADREVQEQLEQQESAVKREQNLQRFREELQRAVQAEYPLSDPVESGLSSFQLSLNLTDADVAPIKADVLAIPEAAYQEKVRQRGELERQRQIALEQQRQAEKQIDQGQVGVSEASGSQNKTSVKLQSFVFDVITVDKNGNENSRTKKTAEFFLEDLGNQVFLEMVKIPGGTFQMGSEEGKGKDCEKPQHLVRVPEFLMGKYSVTQVQWRMVAALPQENIPLNTEPSNVKGDNRPVESVNWDEAVEFCQRLSRLTGHGYRLPSEAEWEYACRAGTKTEFYFGEALTPKLARVSVKTNLAMSFLTLLTGDGESFPVGSYLPNNFGLYDMHGNIWEWCADHWHENYKGAPADGSAWIDNDNDWLLVRGGSWFDSPTNCRAANRFYFSTDFRFSNVGFRLVCAVFPGLL